MAYVLIAIPINLIAVGIASSIGNGSELSGWVSPLLTLPLELVLRVLVGLLGVLIVAFPAIHYATGHHPTYPEALSLLRSHFFRYLLAGLLVSAATVVGTLACIVPGLIVGVVTPIYIRRIFTTSEPIVPAFNSSLRDLFSSGFGWGLVGYELLTGVLLLVSALFCVLPLIVTFPLAAIFIQQYLVSRGLGEPSEA
jgi:uncharacterized membrane protein